MKERCKVQGARCKGEKGKVHGARAKAEEEIPMFCYEQSAMSFPYEL
jgi:hypothetical protein